MNTLTHTQGSNRFKRRLGFITGKAPVPCEQSGFTLIEVLVAMTIIAVGVSALVASAAASAFRSDYLREREFGRWVAANELALLQTLPTWPDIGTKTREVEMGETKWYVKTQTQKVADPDLRRVDVQVRLEKDVDNYIYSVAGFVGNPVTRQLP